MARLMATAQNGLEVLRYGGLETGAVPSPFQIVESVPMYRLRRYFPPDSRRRKLFFKKPAGNSNFCRFTYHVFICNNNIKLLYIKASARTCLCSNLNYCRSIQFYYLLCSHVT